MGEGRLLRAPDLGEAAALVAAVEERSLARAGARLGISQPAMTKRIRALEALVGVPLLERGARGVRATPEGLGLYEQAVRLLAEAERFRAAAEALRRDGAPLRVAVIYSLAEILAVDWLGAYRAAGGATAAEVRVGHPQQVRRWVEAGQSDLGFAAGPVAERPGVVERPFAEDELVVVVAPAHPWATAGSVGLTELTRTPLILREPGSGTRQVLDRALERSGGPHLKAALTLASTPAIRLAVVGQGIPAILSRIAVSDALARAELVEVRIVGLELRRSITVLVRAGGTVSGERRRFLQAAQIGPRSALEAVARGDRDAAPGGVEP